MKARISLFLISSVLFVACGGKPGEAESPQTGTNSSASRERVTLDPKKISVAMRGNEDTYRKCFMQAINSRGAVSLQFLVDTSGTVEEADVTWSSIGKDSVGACLAERLNDQRFGQQRAPSKGRWTFVFNLTDPIDESERDELLEEAAERDENAFQLLPDSRGTIDAGHLDEIVQVNYPLYAHCYRDSIRRRGESRGLLRLRLHIDQQGRLVQVDDAGSILPDPYAVDCMAEAFFAMDFPPPEGGPVLIKYGLDFE